MWGLTHNAPKKNLYLLEFLLIKEPNYNDVKENTIPNSGLL
jgi:hypothetical protein